jgi:hypothetical protein
MRKNKMKNILLDLLADEDRTEDWERTRGDNLTNQFYCGNWSASVQEMIDDNISIKDLIEFLELEEYMHGKSEFNDWFDREFFAELGNTEVRYN